MDDADLVRQVMNGDTLAFAALLDRHGPRVYALCRAWIRRREDAEDRAHDAFCRALNHLTSGRQQPERFGPWLAGIARNVCSDWRRDRENRQIPFSHFGHNGPVGLDPRLDRPAAEEPSIDDELGRLRDAIDDLPEDCREVISLRYRAEATYQEIADALGIAVATVSARLTRGRRLLRERLAPDSPFPTRTASE